MYVISIRNDYIRYGSTAYDYYIKNNFLKGAKTHGTNILNSNKKLSTVYITDLIDHALMFETMIAIDNHLIKFNWFYSLYPDIFQIQELDYTLVDTIDIGKRLDHINEVKDRLQNQKK